MKPPVAAPILLVVALAGCAGQVGPDGAAIDTGTAPAVPPNRTPTIFPDAASST